MNTNDLSLKFDSVFESAIDGIILIDDKGIIQEINQSALTLFGYDKDELLGQNVNCLMPKPHSRDHDKYIKRYHDTHEPRIIGKGREVEGLRKDGSTFPFRLAVNEAKLENVKLFTGFIHDLTAEKKAQQELEKYTENLERLVKVRTRELSRSNEILEQEIKERIDTEKALIESQKLYQTVAENFPNGTICILDKDMKLKFIEGQGLKDVGLGTKELIGKKYTQVIQPEFQDFVLQKLQKVYQGIPATFEMELNSHTFRIRAVPLLNDVNKVDEILIVESNITQQKNAEKEIFNSLQKERELNEMKSRFVSMASHEFRTPLSTILSSSSLINRYAEKGIPDKIKHHTSRIRNNVTNLTMILNDFLSLEKLENDSIPTVKESFNLKECVSEVVEDMHMLKGPDQSIEVSYDVLNDEVESDRFIIQNALNNLISNAIKYSGPEGKIEVVVKESPKTLEITVKDNGIGISDEDQKQLFNRFFRASNAGNIQGTGLGLHIVRRYVDLLGGDIIFKSKLNIGSTFGFILNKY